MSEGRATVETIAARWHDRTGHYPASRDGMSYGGVVGIVDQAADDIAVLLVTAEGVLTLRDALHQLASDMLHFGGLIHDQQGHAEPYATCTRAVCGGIRRAIQRAEEAGGE